jgi:hypothetical protein
MYRVPSVHVQCCTTSPDDTAANAALSKARGRSQPRTAQPQARQDTQECCTCLIDPVFLTVPTRHCRSVTGGDPVFWIVGRRRLSVALCRGNGRMNGESLFTLAHACTCQRAGVQAGAARAGGGGSFSAATGVCRGAYGAVLLGVCELQRREIGSHKVVKAFLGVCPFMCSAGLCPSGTWIHAPG